MMPRPRLRVDGRLPLPDASAVGPAVSRDWLTRRASADLATAAGPRPDPDARRRAMAAHAAATYATRRAATAMRAATRTAAAHRFAVESSDPGRDNA